MKSLQTSLFMLILATVAYAECPSGYFFDSETLNCASCSQQCSECIGNDYSCTKCPEGFYSHDEKCLQLCPNNYKEELKTRSCIIDQEAVSQVRNNSEMIDLGGYSYIIAGFIICSLACFVKLLLMHAEKQKQGIRYQGAPTFEYQLFGKNSFRPSYHAGITDDESKQNSRPSTMKPIAVYKEPSLKEIYVQSKGY